MKWNQNSIIAIFLVFCILFVLGEKCFSENKPLLIITDPYEPYVFPPDAKMKGIDYEVTENVFRMIKIPIQINFFPFKRCLNMIQKRKADAVIDLFKTKERKKYIFFPDEPLSDSSLVLFYHKGHRPKINTLDDLKSYRLGGELSHEYPSELTQVMIKREDVNSMKKNFVKLVNGRVDYMVENRVVGLYTAYKIGLMEQIETLELPKSFPSSYYLGFSKKNGHDQLTEQFSQALVQFKQSKAYHKILFKYGQKN
jgi:polar amino acid transport system substrate-binding protein